ncbi:MAG: 30S ribosomal protein S27e [Nanoarchaeota archaeon]
MEEKKEMSMREPLSKFVKLRCPKCKNEQITFGKAATNVNCLVCGKSLAECTGGKSKIKARILEVLD